MEALLRENNFVFFSSLIFMLSSHFIKDILKFYIYIYMKTCTGCGVADFMDVAGEI